MFLYNVIVFDIPSRRSFVNLVNVNLDKVTFKNSYFLRDTSSGFKKGEQWIEVS